jgi:hypothetical protein
MTFKKNKINLDFKENNLILVKCERTKSFIDVYYIKDADK